jgi:hypothetical protein
MRLLFLASDKEREKDLAAAFTAGAARHGAEIEIRANSATPDLAGFDAVAMVGVKSRRTFHAALAAGIVPVMIDKGYSRHRRADARVWEYWRVSVGAHHPTAGLMARDMPKDRAEAQGFEAAPWRSAGLQIVLAGSSAKYHEFYSLPDPTEWARGVVAELRRYTDRPIIYRPKPSWDGAVPIEGTHWSPPKENFVQTIRNAWAIVTHGSNACFEAALAGIPSIILGEAVAAPISSREIAAIEDPKCGKRGQWLANLAYRQWTEREMQRGLAWEHIGGQIHEFTVTGLSGGSR